MNREQWYRYRRNWRLVQLSIYDDESPISYERRLQIEEHFKAAKATGKYRDRPSKLLFLWEHAKHAIKHGSDRETVRRIVRLYMRENSGKDGRKPPGESYPVYWNWEVNL